MTRCELNTSTGIGTIRVIDHSAFAPTIVKTLGALHLLFDGLNWHTPPGHLTISVHSDTWITSTPPHGSTIELIGRAAVIGSA